MAQRRRQQFQPTLATQADLRKVLDRVDEISEQANTALATIGYRLTVIEHALGNLIEDLYPADEEAVPGDNPGSEEAREAHEQLGDAPPLELEDHEMDDAEWARREAQRLRDEAEAAHQAALDAAEGDFDPNE